MTSLKERLQQIESQEDRLAVSIRKKLASRLPDDERAFLYKTIRDLCRASDPTGNESYMQHDYEMRLRFLLSMEGERNGR